MKRNLKTLWVGAIILLTLAGSAFAGPLTTDYKSLTVFGHTTSGLYDPTERYMVGTQPWVANLLPLQPLYLRGTAQGDTNYFNVLSTAFPGPGWTYQSAARELSANSLVVHTYDVIGSATKVGAEFNVEYKPGVGDPTANLHWIQVVKDNHNLTDNPGHGNAENIVDNPFSPRGILTPNGRSPYYDDGGAANSTQFYDFPWRGDGGKSHTWIADLFLVSGPAIGAGTGKITFYGGVEWGWENHPVPEIDAASATAALALLAGVMGLLAERRRRTRAE